ncbi:hypothetical protein D3C85_1304020 [compost metagenome]
MATGISLYNPLPLTNKKILPFKASLEPFFKPASVTFKSEVYTYRPFKLFALIQGISPPQYSGLILGGVPPELHLVISPSLYVFQLLGIYILLNVNRFMN